MTRKIFIYIFFIFAPILLQAADSASNRKDQTYRIGQKGGGHFLYGSSNPVLLEILVGDWMIGLGKGAGEYTKKARLCVTYEGESQDSCNSYYDTEVTELNFRYYVGNSFNIPFGYSMYKYSGPKKLENYASYEINQFNIGIGNEWTYDWGGFFGIDWLFRGLTTTSTKKNGTEESAETIAKEMNFGVPVNGGFIFTYGFGF